jgi:hypothetical protein
MTRFTDIDNRPAEQMYDYLESRIEAMTRRIAELERENARLLQITNELYAELAVAEFTGRSISR